MLLQEKAIKSVLSLRAPLSLLRFMGCFMPDTIAAQGHELCCSRLLHVDREWLSWKKEHPNRSCRSDCRWPSCVSSGGQPVCFMRDMFMVQRHDLIVAVAFRAAFRFLSTESGVRGRIDAF